MNSAKIYTPPMGEWQYTCSIKNLPQRLENNTVYQRAKKVVSDSPGLVDFAVGLVIFVLNLPDGQVLLWREIQITEGL